MLVRAGRPELDGRPGGLGIAEVVQRPGDDHVPRPMVFVADLVELERSVHDGGGCGAQHVVRRPHDDASIVDGEVDRADRRGRRAGYSEPTDPAPFQEAKAVSTAEHRQATGLLVTVEVHESTSLRHRHGAKPSD